MTDLFFRRFARVARLTAVAAGLGLLLVPQVLRANEEPVNGQGVLWRIEPTAEGAAPSYLFGTMHVTDDRVHDLPPPVAEAFAQARHATFEIIMTPEARLAMGRAMVLADGRTLDALVGPNLWTRTVAVGAAYGIPEAQLRHLKPWAVATIFSVPRRELARTAAGDLPLDQRLEADARSDGKTIHALETPDEQIDLFDDIPLEDQVALLEAAVADNHRIDEIFREMVALYLERDLGGIYTQMVAQMEGDRARVAELFRVQFNEARNEIMARRMGDLLRQGGAFIAVGALHLPGDKGLVSQLAARGHRVTRVY